MADRFGARSPGVVRHSPSIHHEFERNAILIALRHRSRRGTLIHSDGTQFRSDAWRRFCHSHRLVRSISRQGYCSDSGVVESVFRSLKRELAKKQIHKSRDLAPPDVADFAESFYSPMRRHSHGGRISPEQF
jgi:putative transposase